MSEFDWIPPIRVKMNAKPKAIPMPDWCKKRYQDAHDLSFSDIIKKDGLNFNAKIPDTNKANGLTLAIVNFSRTPSSALSNPNHLSSYVRRIIPFTNCS